jgi:PPM family protein phosphatase
MRVEPDNAQVIGAREEQQDAFGYAAEDSAFVAHGGRMVIVADGMGGMAAGREASRAAVAAMLDSYHEKTKEEPIPEALQRSLLAANEAVFQMAKSRNLVGSTGTTAVAAVVHGSILYWTWAGDSRIYLVRGEETRLISEDHVHGRSLDAAAERGLLSTEEAENDPRRAHLNSFLGLERVEEVGTGKLALGDGDVVMLCSDGVSGALSESEIAEAVQAGPFLGSAARVLEHLREKALPGQDNATVALLGLGAPSATRKAPRMFSRTQVAILVAGAFGLGIAAVSFGPLVVGSRQLAADSLQVPTESPGEPRQDSLEVMAPGLTDHDGDGVEDEAAQGDTARSDQTEFYSPSLDSLSDGRQ